MYVIPGKCIPFLFALAATILVLPGSDLFAERQWSKQKKPSPAKAAAIGGYSAGCVQGAVAIPGRGQGYQTMRPSRRRIYGHPDLRSFIQEFAKSVDENDLGPVLIGDLGQAKGGPSPSGHASHQSGLDVDIWYWHPKWAEGRRLIKREREQLSAKSVVNSGAKAKTRYWSGSLESILRIAASSPKVSRIFVNPLVKKFLCQSTSKDRKYLRNLRPWYGHANHMHVRLHCPKDSPDCEPQKALPAGDGCDTLNWWFDDKAQADRKKNRKKYQSKVGASPTLPAACLEMLSE